MGSAGNFCPLPPRSFVSVRIPTAIIRGHDRGLCHHGHLQFGRFYRTMPEHPARRGGMGAGCHRQCFARRLLGAGEGVQTNSVILIFSRRVRALIRIMGNHVLPCLLHVSNLARIRNCFRGVLRRAFSVHEHWVRSVHDQVSRTVEPQTVVHVLKSDRQMLLGKAGTLVLGHGGLGDPNSGTRGIEMANQKTVVGGCGHVGLSLGIVLATRGAGSVTRRTVLMPFANLQVGSQFSYHMTQNAVGTQIGRPTTRNSG